MAAEHRELSLWIGLRNLAHGLAHGHASEMRRPVVVGDAPLVPTRFTKRRDVREHYDVRVSLEGSRQHAAEMLRGLVPQSLEPTEALLLIGRLGQLVDQKIVVQ